MKKAAKVLSLVFALAMTTSAFAGCGGGSDPGTDPGNKPIDADKTQIKVQNYEGGYGRAWLDNAIARFEEEHKNTEFEPGSGKKGIQIHVTSSINGTAGSQVATGASGNEHHIFFTEDLFYYDATGYGAAADITDIVTEKLTAYGETRSIEDKMDPNVKEFLNQGTETEPSYKGLPHYFSYRTFYYDVDIFDLYGFWMLADGTFAGQKSGYNVSKLGTAGWELSRGIDGDNGHEFDGLPATYDEFFAMCDYMIARGVTPMHTYGSGSPLNQIVYSSWAQNEGRDSFLQTLNPVGTSDRIVKSINAQGVAELYPADTAVDPYNVQAQLGKYQAYQFADRLAQGTEAAPKYFHDLSFSTSENNIQAQYTYLMSSVIGEPIAMYQDGVWWENEAYESGSFSDVEILSGKGRMDRRFGLLPIPFATEEMVGNKWTINSNCNLSLSFINSNIKDTNILNASKKFLQFLHTDAEMQNFSVQTSTLKPFNYEIPESKMENMTYFGKNLLSLTNSPNVDIVYTYSPYLGYIQDFSYYYPGEIGWGTQDVVRYFFRNTNKTAADFFWLTKEQRNSAFKPPVA